MNYSLPQAIWLSFYSAPMYRSISQSWRARSAVYLFLVLVLCWTPGFVMMHKTITLAFDSFRARILTQIPSLTIEKGQLRTPEDKPYILDWSEAGTHLRVVIDTTGRYKTLEEAEAVVLITAKQAFVRRSLREVRTYEFSSVKDAVYDRAMVEKWVDRIEHWTPRLLYPALFLLSFLKRFIQALLVALIGILICHALEAKLNFAALFTLAIVSMTPSMVLGAALSAAGAQFPLQWLLLGLIGFGTFLFAINSATETVDDDA